MRSSARRISPDAACVEVRCMNRLRPLVTILPTMPRSMGLEVTGSRCLSPSASLQNTFHQFATMAVRLRELSDTYGVGSRTARQDASAARSDDGPASAGPPSDKAERRGMTMMAAGDAGRGAGAREDAPRRNDARCRKCKFGFDRGRKRTGTFSDEPICAGLAAKANLVVAEPREDAQIGRIKRRGPLQRTKTSLYTAKQPSATGYRAGAVPRLSSPQVIAPSSSRQANLFSQPCLDIVFGCVPRHSYGLCLRALTRHTPRPPPLRTEMG